MKIFKYLKRRDILCALICVAMVVVQIWMELTMPDYTQKLTAAVSSGSVEMSDVLTNGGMMSLCALVSLLASFVCGYFAAMIAASFARTLRFKLFDTITGFGDTEYNRFTTPSLITRTTNDVVQMQTLIAMGLQLMVKAPIMAVWAICKISATSVEWTLAALITVLVIFVLVGSLVLLCYPRFKRIQKLTDDLNDATRENISGIRVVRAFNAEKYQQKKFSRVNEEITSNNLFTGRTMGLMSPIMSLCSSGLTLAIYWIGVYLINAAPVMERATWLGNMTAFIQYAMQIVMSFMMLVAIFIILPRTMVSAKRINEVLDTKPVLDYPTEPVAADGRGKVEFRNVSFAYSDEANACLSGLSFTVEPGSTFAIIGATGTGKSTLINLIPRFYDVTEGAVLIDGVDVRNYSKDQLEKMVSVAPQKATLFMGDIKSNVTYGCGREVADDDATLRQALDIAQAEFVDKIEKGVHAEVAQGGTNFSGGQKQRLSIARAVFKNSPIMIFDDTFSALDYKTDMLVRQGLREHLGNTTVIIVAQRIGTIRNADRILVLDDGKIAGIGTHRELLENCSVYKEIALSQLSKEEL